MQQLMIIVGLLSGSTNYNRANQASDSKYFFWLNRLLISQSTRIQSTGRQIKGLRTLTVEVELNINMLYTGDQVLREQVPPFIFMIVEETQRNECDVAGRIMLDPKWLNPQWLVGDEYKSLLERAWQTIQEWIAQEAVQQGPSF